MQGREQGGWERAVTQHCDDTASDEIARFDAFEILLLSVSLYHQSPIRQARETGKHI